MAEWVHISAVGLGNGLGAPQHHLLGRYHRLQAAASPQPGTSAGSVLCCQAGTRAAQRNRPVQPGRRWMWMATLTSAECYTNSTVSSQGPAVCSVSPKTRCQTRLTGPVQSGFLIPNRPGLRSIHDALTCVSPLAELQAHARGSGSGNIDWLVASLLDGEYTSVDDINNEPAAVCDACALWQRSRKKV